MRKVLHRDMIGDVELITIEVSLPGHPEIVSYGFEARKKLPNGALSRALTDNTQGFVTASEAREAGRAFAAKLTS